MPKVLRRMLALPAHLVRGRSPFVHYFLHIPKVGGTTVHSQLAPRFNCWRINPTFTPVDLLRMPEARFDAIELFSGHFPFGYHLDRLVSRPVRRIVFLREPRAHFLSVYKQVKQDPADTFHDYVERNCPSLESFLDDAWVVENIRNFQSRCLAVTERAFDLEMVEAIRTAHDSEIPALLEEFCRSQPALTDRELLRRAVERVRQCWFVGVTERMDESLNALASRLNWRPFQPTVPKNRSADRRVAADLSPRILRQIDRLTSLDRVLYEEAITLNAPATIAPRSAAA